MLKIVVPASEQFDNATQTFIHTKEQTLQLEHSLVSLSNGSPSGASRSFRQSRRRWRSRWIMFGA